VVGPGDQRHQAERLHHDAPEDPPAGGAVDPTQRLHSELRTNQTSRESTLPVSTHTHTHTHTHPVVVLVLLDVVELLRQPPDPQLQLRQLALGGDVGVVVGAVAHSQVEVQRLGDATGSR